MTTSSMAMQWVGLIAAMMVILSAVSVSMVHSQSPAMLHQLLGGWMTGGHNWEGQGWFPGHIPHSFPGKLRVPPGQQFPGQLAPPKELQTQALLREAAEGKPGSLGYFTLGKKPFIVMAPASGGLLRSEAGIDGYAGPDGWIAPIEGNDISLTPVEEENWPLVEENAESLSTPQEENAESIFTDDISTDAIEGTLTFSEPISIGQ